MAWCKIETLYSWEIFTATLCLGLIGLLVKVLLCVQKQMCSIEAASKLMHSKNKKQINTLLVLSSKFIGVNYCIFSFQCGAVFFSPDEKAKHTHSTPSKIKQPDGKPQRFKFLSIHILSGLLYNLLEYFLNVLIPHLSSWV